MILNSMTRALVRASSTTRLTSSRTVTTTNNDSSNKLSTKSKLLIQQEHQPLAESVAQRAEFGLMFDIDGVLLRGKSVLPHTRDCLRLITDSSGNFTVPTVFVTNAGNQLRSTKAAKLAQLLGVNVRPEQMIMSHSPLKMMRRFHQKRCLVVGQGPIIEIAQNLGFKNIVTVDDIRKYYPHLDVVDHKRRNFAPCVLARYFPPIDAIVLFGESIRWETNLQIIIDVLMSSGDLDSSPRAFPGAHIPILACNMDMIWMAEALMPRFGHGTFLYCLEQLYGKLSGGRQLQYSAMVGKPNELTYYYAEEMLQNHAESIGIPGERVRRLYAVGDNLDTDVYGANIFNQILQKNKEYKSLRSNGSPDLIEQKLMSLTMSEEEEDTMTTTSTTTSKRYVSRAESINSILVQTGVYQGDGNDLDTMISRDLAHRDTRIDEKLVKPNYVSKNVYEAVKLVFELENYNH